MRVIPSCSFDVCHTELLINIGRDPVADIPFYSSIRRASCLESGCQCVRRATRVHSGKQPNDKTAVNDSNG